ncbi:MAG: pitrilysin family protein [Chromatiales bacterium]|nr:pitrilysin family protein [Chromatiales bacterium]
MLKTTLRLFLPVFLLLAAPLVSAAPRIQHWTTDNGLRVYFVEARELPMLDLRLVFNAGSARDGELAGVARLTSGLLNNGAGEWDADTIANRFESVGAQYGGGALRDMAWVNLRTLTSDADWLETALTTYITVVGAPNFPQRDLDRALRNTRVALQGRMQNPGEIAQTRFLETLYAGHPYASDPLGTEQSLDTIRREDLQAFHARHYVARNGVLALVGDLDRAGAERIAARIAAVLAEGEPAPALPAPPARGEATTLRIEFPSEQSHVLIGQPAIARGDADYFPLYVGNHVLGGSGLTSRLFDEVRGKRGLAYSVYSYFLPMTAPGPFMMGVQTQGAQAEEAIGVMRDLLRDYIDKGPTEAELAASKRNITGGFPLRTASNSDIVEQLGMIGFYDLPLDWLDRFSERVEAVTVDDVREAFRRHVQPDRLVTVVVGG